MISIAPQFTIRDSYWIKWKVFQNTKLFSIQFDEGDTVYQIWGYDGPEAFTCTIYKDAVPLEVIAAGYTQEQNDTDKTDFETNFKPTANGQISTGQVTTQYEKNDKDLKLAKIKASVESGTPNKAEIRLKIPGTFGDSTDGRWIAGGDGWLDTYDPDDYIVVECYDDDGLISAAYGGLTDEQMQAQGDFPQYPLIKSYTDTDLSDDNQGWYFWALSQGNLPPIGEIEFEPIAGYGHIPSGLYLVITIIRPNQVSGTFRGNLFWGKKE